MPGEREDQTPTSGQPNSPDQRPAQSVFGNRGDLSFLGVPPPVSPPQPQTPSRPAEASTSSTPPQEGPTAIITPGSSEDAIRAVETAAARPILPRITDEPSVSEDQPIMPPPAGPDTSAPLEPEQPPFEPLVAPPGASGPPSRPLDAANTEKQEESKRDPLALVQPGTRVPVDSSMLDFPTRKLMQQISEEDEEIGDREEIREPVTPSRPRGYRNRFSEEMPSDSDVPLEDGARLSDELPSDDDVPWTPPTSSAGSGNGAGNPPAPPINTSPIPEDDDEPSEDEFETDVSDTPSPETPQEQRRGFFSRLFFGSETTRTPPEPRSHPESLQHHETTRTDQSNRGDERSSRTEGSATRERDKTPVKRWFPRLESQNLTEGQVKEYNFQCRRDSAKAFMEEYAKPAPKRNYKRITVAAYDLDRRAHLERTSPELGKIEVKIQAKIRDIKDILASPFSGGKNSIQVYLDIHKRKILRDREAGRIDDPQDAIASFQKLLNELRDLQAPLVEELIEFRRQKQEILDRIHGKDPDYLEGATEYDGLDPDEAREKKINDAAKSLGIVYDAESYLMGARKLWSDQLGTINIEASTVTDFKFGISQYLDYVESQAASTGNYDKIFGNIQRIRELIDQAKEQLGLPSEEADIIADLMDARLMMVIHHKAARVGNSGTTAGIKKAFWEGRGKERINALFTNPDISGFPPELLMKAFEMIANDPRYITYFRPYGPRGELSTSAESQDYLRDEVMKEFVDQLMRYEIVGDASGTRNEKLIQILHWQTKDKFNGLYKEHPSPAREGETKKEFNERLKQAKRAAEIAFQLNAFMGHQAETRGASVVMSNGDFVHRRHAEYYVKYRLRQKMEELGLTPIELEKFLLSFKAWERSPRLTEAPHADLLKRLKTREQKETVAKLAELANESEAALDDLWERGNSVTFNGLGLEEIIKDESVRIVYEGFMANDHPARSLIIKADPNGDGPDSMLKRILDPKNEVRVKGANRVEKREFAEALDFVHRLQVEASMAVFDRFLPFFDQESQGKGPLTETRIFDNRSTLAANYDENTRYAAFLIAYLPEIYSFPLNQGVQSMWELIQIMNLGDPNMAKKYPELFENFSGEIWAIIYSLIAQMKKDVTPSMDEKTNEEDKGVFYEPVGDRFGIVDYNQSQIKTNTAEAEKVTKKFATDHFSNAKRVINYIKRMCNFEKKMEILNPASWMSGIFFDKLIDWCRALQIGGSNEAGGQAAYAKRVADALYKILEIEDKGIQGTARYPDSPATITEKIKEVMVPAITKMR